MKCPYCGAETVNRKCEYCNSDLSEHYANNGTIGGAVSGAINNIGQSIANNINRNNNPNNFPNNNPNFPNNYQNMSNAQPQIVQNIIIGQNPQPQPQPRLDVSPKNRTLAIILCIVGFFGCGGLHRFYTGHILSGILWLCTGGLGGVGTVIDLLLLISNSFKDSNQLKLMPEEKL